MKKFIILILFSILILTNIFGYSSNGYLSKHLIYKNSDLLTQYFTENKKFDYIEKILIANEITTKKTMNAYKKEINKISNEIRNNFNNKDKIKLARYIFDYLHKNYLKEYKNHAYNLKHIFIDEKYNCVSSTILYNLLLHKFGFNPKMVLTRDHTYTILNIKNEEIFIENTTKNGFNYVNNPNLTNKEEILEKIEGTKKILSTDSEIITAIYSNSIYYIKDYRKAFQYALRALAHDKNALEDYHNIKAAFSNYISYISKHKDYKRAYNIMTEALNEIGKTDFILDNYKLTLNNYILKLINIYKFNMAFDILNKSKDLIDDKSFINDKFFIYYTKHGIYIYQKKDYKNSIELFKKAYEIKPEDKASINNLQAAFIMASQKNIEQNNFQKAYTYAKRGLKIFPDNKPLNDLKIYSKKNMK